MFSSSLTQNQFEMQSDLACFSVCDHWAESLRLVIICILGFVHKSHKKPKSVVRLVSVSVSSFYPLSVSVAQLEAVCLTLSDFFWPVLGSRNEL